MLSLFVDTAHAMGGAPAEGAPAPNPIVQFIPLILIFVVFYFLMIRPQQKQAKERKAMLDNVKRGDEIVTSGGIIGRVTDVADDTLMLEIAKDVRVKIQRGAVFSVNVKKSE